MGCSGDCTAAFAVLVHALQTRVLPAGRVSKTPAEDGPKWRSLIDEEGVITHSELVQDKEGKMQVKVVQTKLTPNLELVSMPVVGREKPAPLNPYRDRCVWRLSHASLDIWRRRRAVEAMLAGQLEALTSDNCWHINSLTGCFVLFLSTRLLDCWVGGSHCRPGCFGSAPLSRAAEPGQRSATGFCWFRCVVHRAVWRTFDAVLLVSWSDPSKEAVSERLRGACFFLSALHDGDGPSPGHQPLLWKAPPGKRLKLTEPRVCMGT